MVDQATKSRVARTAPGTSTLNTLGLGPLWLRATFHHPITRAKIPLPPHRWTLTATAAQGGAVVSSIGIESDPEGVSVIFPGDEATNPVTDWSISWAPILPAGVPHLGADRVVWVDVDAKQWAAPPEPAKLVQEETRSRLVRLVAWDSVQKAKSGGFETPPTAAKGVGKGLWDKGGVIEGVVLPHARREHGKKSDAWELVVDHQWFFTYLVFHRYSLVKEKSVVVPPGLLVEAHDSKRKVVGGGVAVRTDGLIYVLHNRTQAASSDLDYAFTTPVSTIIDVKATEPPPGADGALGAPDKRMKQVSAVTGDIRSRYLLPFDWHTRGWDARIQDRVAWTPAPSAAAPAIRTQATTLAAPLLFHLDDTVLVGDDDKPLVLPDKSPVTVFDQLLRIPRPLAAMPHVTDPLLSRNYLAAERYMCPDGTKVRDWPRIIDHDGKVHDVQDRRLPGTAGTTVALGARIARADAHPLVDFSRGHPRMNRGCYELHLIDTLVEDWDYDGKKRRLFHLVVYTSAFVTNVSAGAGAVDAVLANLNVAAGHWSAGHPSNTNSKPYAVAPVGGGKQGGPVVLVRAFFGHRQKQVGGKLVIQMLKKVRANVGGSVMQLEITNVADTTDTRQDIDGKAEFENTMAHEFGHACGLTDEYLERLEDTWLPPFNQPSHGGPARPFFTDLKAMMRNQFLERLRYLWHHVYSLNHEASLHGPLGGDVFVAEDRAYPGGPLVYQLPVMPESVMPGEADAHPWVPVGRKRLPNRRGEVVLYRLGPDESAVDALYAGATSGTLLTEPLDGLLLVRTNYEFRVAPGITTAERNAAATALFGVTHDAMGRPYQSPLEWSAILADAPLLLRRIGIQFQPYFALGSAPSPPDIVVAVGPDGAKAPNDLALSPTEQANLHTFRVPKGAVGNGLLRLALGLPTNKAGGLVNNDPIEYAELAGTKLVSLVSEILKDSTGASRTMGRLYLNLGALP